MRWFSLGPVFLYECIVGARRWQLYAGRFAFLGALLVSLTVVWFLRFPHDGAPLHRNALAAVGEAFYFATAGTQLVLVLLAAPAYTAASICLDKARGTLTHMLVTDLTATEIVVGKMVARGLPVLGLLLAGAPVLVLATLLGGVEPEAVALSFAIVLSVALVSCALALAFSVWGTKPHEVLLATYVVESIWLLTWPIAEELRLSGVSFLPSLNYTNPFWLLFSVGAELEDIVAFAGVCVGLSVCLIAFAVLTLRRAARRDGVRRKAWFRMPRVKLASPPLDWNPVLWREWRRRVPSRWLQFIWGVYLVVSLGAAILAFVARGHDMPPFVNAFQFSIGLLLVSITAVASLFEERVNGSLDVLLATPLSTTSIVLGKWLAGLRILALVTILPACLSFLLLIFDGGRPGSDYGGIGHFVLLILLMVGYGALVNSFALAVATWVSRFSVAMGLTVAGYVLLTAGPVLLLLAMGPGGYSNMRGFAGFSPWYGVGETTAQLHRPFPDDHNGWKVMCALVYTITAGILLWITVRTFDQCLGRAGPTFLPANWRRKPTTSSD